MLLYEWGKKTDLIYVSEIKVKNIIITFFWGIEEINTATSVG